MTIKINSNANIRNAKSTGTTITPNERPHILDRRSARAERRARRFG